MLREKKTLYILEGGADRKLTWTKEALGNFEKKRIYKRMVGHLFNAVN